MKKAIAFVLALILGASSYAQNYGAQTQTLVLSAYNLNATTETYCSLGPETVVSDGRVASAASTTYTAASGTPYLNVAVGDYIRGNDITTGASYEKTVVARASSTSITVSNAVTAAGWPTQGTPTLTNASIVLRKLTCGTANDDGAFPVGGSDKISITFGIKQVVATGGIDVRLLCRSTPASAWVQVVPALTAPAVAATYLNYATATVGQVLFESTATYSDCRIGMLIHTADDGNDLTTNSEQVYIWVRTRS